MTTQTIRIQLRNVYGQFKAYPACRHAEVFCDLLGTKTLTGHALAHIMRLGYTVIEMSARDRMKEIDSFSIHGNIDGRHALLKQLAS
jgi:hypothetical protein